MFVDRATIRVEGGVGGSGAEAFRRETGVPRGGPSGGDGGAGGSVVLVCDPQLSTLLDFRYRSEYVAPRGAHGEGSNRTGRSGEDLLVRVPPGTLVREAETGEVLAELLAEGDQVVVARGGRGGRGNAKFATATRQAPRHWEVGAEGEKRTIELTLKLLADIGLVGEPNAGKSTLLSAISAARPRVADYPFTTLTPQLGVVDLGNYRSLVVADIPGLIEGAWEGRGLGHRFLQHIERTRVLAILIPVDAEDPQESYDGLRAELRRYSPALAERPHLLVLTKTDLLGPDEEPPQLEAPDALEVRMISAVARQGLGDLLEAFWRHARSAEAAEGGSGGGQPAAGGALGSTGTADAGDRAPSEEEVWWEALDRDL